MNHRRTTMYYVPYPPTCKSLPWLEHVAKRVADVEQTLLLRVFRKAHGKIMSLNRVTRRVRNKWHDKSGASPVYESTMTWTEE